MVKIEAVVRPERINIVIEAITTAGCSGFHISNVTGKGIQDGVEVFTARGSTTVARVSLPKVLLTTVVTDDIASKVIDAIISAARSPNGGAIGDGKIFVSQVAEVIRVRTGEKNQEAL